MAEDGGDDRLYRWTVRGLYVLAIGLNVWILWDQVRDSPEGVALRAKASGLRDAVSQPWRDRQHFRRNANRVIYEATTIVEEGENDADGS